MLDELASAIAPDWHGARAAGRVERHVDVLRDVAHAISPSPDRPDRPRSAAEAASRLDLLVSRLEATAPRTGLGAATGHFVDHVAALARRYGSRLFVCFDDARVPATTNELEGFFGEVKGVLRRASGRGSTANTLAPSLGADYLVAMHHARHGSNDAVRAIDPAAFTRARARMHTAEAPARRRRALARNLDDHLEDLIDRWRRVTPRDGEG